MPEWIQNALVRQIVEYRLAPEGDGSNTQPAAILHRIDDPRGQSLITEALIEERPIPQPEQQLSDIVTRLRNQSIDREVATLNQTLGQPDLPPEETNVVLQELAAVRAAKRGPLTPLSTTAA